MRAVGGRQHKKKNSWSTERPAEKRDSVVLF